MDSAKKDAKTTAGGGGSASAAALATWLLACKHPLRAELDELRVIVQSSVRSLVEGVKWNAPSWHLPDHEDCITGNLGKDCLRLVFHRGAKVKDGGVQQPFVDVEHGWLEWPSGDRAVATFRNGDELRAAKPELVKLVRAWVAAFERSVRRA